MAGCWVALGCPSWAMTLQLCMIHSISQTRVGLVTEIGSDGTASVYKQLRRKDWECQDLRGLLSDGVSASFYTIKGPRRQKCRTSRRGGGGRSPSSGLQLRARSCFHSLNAVFQPAQAKTNTRTHLIRAKKWATTKFMCPIRETLYPLCWTQKQASSP